MKKRINLTKFIAAILVVAVTAVIGLQFQIQSAIAEGSSQSGGGAVSSCKPEYDKYGGCYSLSANGAWWIKVSVGDNPSVPYSSLGFAYLRKDVRGMSLLNCNHGEKAAYVLVTPMYNSKGQIIGLGAGIPLNEARPYLKTGDGMGIGSSVSPAQAEAAFDKHYEDTYSKAPWNQKEYSDPNSTTTYFCADPEPTSSSTTTTTTTTTPPVYRFSCYATRTREMGDTKTRIAVRNVTLDGWGSYPNVRWPAKGNRSALPSDSWWTDSGGTYWTIAKPGDSVQFLHEFCAGDRYVRRTPTQDAWVYKGQSHTVIFDIPKNNFKIGASPDYYAFPSGISWANGEVAANGAKYEDVFTNPNRNGMWVDSTRYGVGTLSPTPEISSYNCFIADYLAHDRWAGSGSFQIPGFDSGSCASASATRSNTVGQTVTQWHDFNMVKAWEQWTHDFSGSCGCINNNSARFGGRTFSPEYGKPRSNWGNRQNWVCDGTSCTDCCYCCDGYYDKYGVWHCTKKCGDKYKYLEPDDYNLEYHSKSKDYGNARKTAHVYVPYNFETSLDAQINNNDDVIFQGTAIGSSFDWNILRRTNSFTTKSDMPSYATVTPPGTKVQMIEFLYAPGDGKKITGNTKSSSGPCAYYSGAAECKVIETLTGNQNPRGLYAGTTNSKQQNRIVPDNSEYVGYKYCVAVGIYPSDSHNYLGQKLSREYSYGVDGAMDAGEYWNISNASCRTIGKKPSIQVWNGSVYTEGDISTSLTKKEVGKGLGNNYSESNTTIFGSWTDYAILAGGTNNGLASGAMLGYNNSKYNLSGTAGQRTNQITFKHMSPQTISNSTGTKNSGTGGSGIAASTSIEVNLQRLYARYSDKAESYATTSDKAIHTAKTGMQYLYHSGDIKLSQVSIQNESDTATYPNQTTTKSGSSIVKGLGNGKDDNTLVIYVKGKLTIDGNICLGSCSGSGMKLSNYSYGSTTNSAAKIPQVVIFADNIDIDQSVSRIDAWLIVAGGTINTCKDYKIGDNLSARDAYGRYSYGNCYKTLIINGPVYASALKLNRTAGATHGQATSDDSDVLNRQFGADGSNNDGNLGSQTPAEIFNLRADSYLWAYNQAQRYSEAVVTYTRELAPRY